MAYLFRLSLTYLRKQRMRTMMTLASLILGVYLMTGFGVLIGAFAGTANEYVKTYVGGYHLSATNLTEEQAQKLCKNIRVEQGGYGRAFLLGQREEDTLDPDIGLKLMVDKQEFSLVGQDQLGIGGIFRANPAYYALQSQQYFQLQSGAYPQNDQEIAMDQRWLEQFDAPPAVGDSVTITVEADRLSLTPLEEADPSIRDTYDSESGFYKVEKALDSGGKMTISLLPGFAQKLDALCEYGMSIVDATRTLLDLDADQSEQWVMYHYYKHFQIDFGQTEKTMVQKTYRLSGIIRCEMASASMLIFDQDSTFDCVAIVHEGYDTYVEIGDQSTSAMDDIVKGLSEDSGVPADRFEWNELLLMTELRGEMFMTGVAFLLGAIGLVLILLFFIVRLMIDNAFELSAKERIRQFGVLRTLGATKGQISMMLLMEAVVLTLVAVPIGFLMAVGTGQLAVHAIADCAAQFPPHQSASFAYFALTPDMVKLGLRPGILWVMVGICTIGIFISVFTFMYRMLRLSASQTLHFGKPQAPKKLKKGRRRIWLSRKLFGFPFGLACRNVKRSPKQYWVSVLSLSLSVMLFVVSFSMISTAKQSIAFNQSEKAAFFMDLEDDVTQTESTALMQSLRPSCTRILPSCNLDVQLADPTGQLRQGVCQAVASRAEKAQNNVNVCLYVISRENYDLFRTSVSYDALLAQKGILFSENACIRKGGTFGEPVRRRMEPLVTDPQAICGSYAVTSSKKEVQMPVLGTFDTQFSGFLSDRADTLTGMIAAENAGILTDDSMTRYQIYVEPQNMEAVGEMLEQWSYDGKLFYYSEALESAFSATTVQIVGIILTAVMAMLGMISVLNMFNTILTGILNRRREYYMLRACGMSRAQLSGTIFSEGISMLLTVTVLAGVPATIVINVLCSSMLDIGLILPLKQILMILGAGLVLVFLSSLQPLKSVGNRPIAQGIRELEE